MSPWLPTLLINLEKGIIDLQLLRNLCILTHIFQQAISRTQRLSYYRFEVVIKQPFLLFRHKYTQPPN